MGIEWKEVKGDVWNPEKKGDQITGLLIAKTPGTLTISARYYIDTREGHTLVWGSAALDILMKSVELMDLIRITYHGKKEIGKNKTLKLFKLERGFKTEHGTE